MEVRPHCELHPIAPPNVDLIDFKAIPVPHLHVPHIWLRLRALFIYVILEETAAPSLALGFVLRLRVVVL